MTHPIQRLFDCPKEDEVIGIRVNTTDFTWPIPHDKLTSLVTNLRKIASGKDTHFSLREFERVLGKLNHVSQFCLPLKTFTSEATFLSARLEMHQKTHTGERPYECNHCYMSFAHTGHLK